MANSNPFAGKAFRIGIPGLPGRSTSQVDEAAALAISHIDDALGEIRWLTPDQAVARLDLDDPSRWFEEFARTWLEHPFGEDKGHESGGALDAVFRAHGLTNLLREVRAEINGTSRPLNTTALLENDNILEFSFALAVYVVGIGDAPGIASWITDDEDGAVASFRRLVVIEALNQYVNVKKIEVDAADGDGNINRVAFDAAVNAEGSTTTTSFESGTFTSYLESFVDDFAFRRGPLGLINTVNDDLGLHATSAEIRYLAEYFQNSPIVLAENNAADVVPVVLTQYRSTTSGSVVSASTLAGPLDFGVRYHTATHDSATINVENVQCAAQLFYVMTLGDELGVFRASDLLITRKLGVGQVDVQSPALLRNLQDYAFNDEFRDVSTGRLHQRTSPEERQMFYRQVFDLGDTQLLDGMVTNVDFTHLWSSLMVETVRYIEKVEKSDQPEAYVSRNAVARVMDDLRYNLSTYCSGMAKVMTPIIYRELDFLIEQVWKSQEIIDQLALHNSGSYWRAIERCLQEDAGQSVGLTALLKKAEYGHRILQAVAEYTPQTVLDDGTWSSFVSTVEAFIITSEQIDVDHDGSDAAPPGPPMLNGVPGMNGTTPADEWAF